MLKGTRDQENSFHHEGSSAAEPQPKKKCNFYHEEHEVKKFRNINIRNLRGLRVLGGEEGFRATMNGKEIGVRFPLETNNRADGVIGEVGKRP
jgi:hypothetical protein